jgi:demethylmenaquinone methyltransferase/2-methoxy-6-polyprenyl-1,4-benzoquinol methylase
MFDAIARRYDTLNRVLSAGLDRRWRRRAIRELALTGRERVVDVCTGTADVALEAAARGARHVVGVDFAGAMLEIGRDKIARAAPPVPVHLVRGDATALPVASASADAATVAFGIRNVVDVEAACRELARVLKRDGRLAILEFGMPRMPIVRSLYAAYFRYVLPRIGRAVSRHGSAYDYLPASVAQFPSGREFAALLERAGFRDVRPVPLAAGAVYLYVARRP